jgi:hypothetical protein
MRPTASKIQKPPGMSVPDETHIAIMPAHEFEFRQCFKVSDILDYSPDQDRPHVARSYHGTVCDAARVQGHTSLKGNQKSRNAKVPFELRQG